MQKTFSSSGELAAGSQLHQQGEFEEGGQLSSEAASCQGQCGQGQGRAEGQGQGQEGEQGHGAGQDPGVSFFAPLPISLLILDFSSSNVFIPHFIFISFFFWIKP